MATQPTIADLYNEVKADHPALTGRLERGVNLANGGHVRQLTDGIFTVKSLLTGHQYVVAFQLTIDQAPGWHCGCADIKNGAPRTDWYGSVGRPVCKHIIAASLVEMLTEPVMTEAETEAETARWNARHPAEDYGLEARG